QLRLRQRDVELRGGPGQGTMRNIEQAARDGYALRTFDTLERALEWPAGTVTKILDGTATEGDLNARVQSGVPPTPLDPATAISAPIPATSTPTPAPALTPDDELALRIGRIVLAVMRAEGAIA